MSKSDKAFVTFGVCIYLLALLFLSAYGGEYVDIVEATWTIAGMCVGTILIIMGFGGYYMERMEANV